MRIAFIANPESPNAWYRAVGPLVALGQRGHEIRQVLRLDGAFRSDLVSGCDVLHIHRQHDEHTLAAARYAKGHGIAVVWDNDDDLTAVPRGTPAHRDYGGLKGERTLAAIRKLAAMTDLVTTPSARLAERFDALGARRVQVIENYVRDEFLHVSRPEGNGSVTIGWLAGVEHHLDIERVPIRAALARLLEAHPHVRVISIGAGVGLRDDRYRHIRQCDFLKLPELMAEFDVGLAVIADIPFNHARSNVKLKEYAALGVPWLASPAGPYVELGERQGGRLVADDCWYEALERLVTRERERRRLAKRAAKWGRGQTIGANVARWEAAFEEAVERARSGAAAHVC